jgi:hypothetical protein
MRHRGQINDENLPNTAGGTTLETLTDLLATPPRKPPGKHRAAVDLSAIPVQKLPTHDTVVEAPALVAPAVRALPGVPAAPVVEAPPVVEVAPVDEVTPAEQPATPTPVVPDTARWRASHLPRVLAGTVLAMAALGTSALIVRYAQSRTGDDLVSLAIGVGVVVVLWAVLIASTPQVVTLRGPVLTVHNTGGSDQFDLADALQPVDVVGDPRTSHWAVLLHRPHSTTIVLRRNDVIASELDPIVRHYRRIAEQRHAERDARFSR